MPFAGYIETENGRFANFLKGTHREIRVLREKFDSNTWKMMIGVGGININGDDHKELFYPENGIDTNPSTWQIFSFSK